MNFHSILAATDLTPQGNRAVLRAAMLAAQQRALLKIMYAPSDLDGSISTDVEQDLKRLGAEIYARFNVLVKIVANTGGHLQAVAEEAQWVGILVIGEHWEKSTRAFFCGQPIERLERVVPCPILLARLKASHRYRRILVATDFTPYSKKLLKLARWLEGDAHIEPFQARRPLLGRNDVARQAVIQKQHSNVDLIVVGKRRSSGFSDLLFGSEAHHVLRWSSGDVLLVPHDLRNDPKPEMAASPTAQRDQMAAEHPAGRSTE